MRKVLLTKKTNYPFNPQLFNYKSLKTCVANKVMFNFTFSLLLNFLLESLKRTCTMSFNYRTLETNFQLIDD